MNQLLLILPCKSTVKVAFQRPLRAVVSLRGFRPRQVSGWWIGRHRFGAEMTVADYARRSVGVKQFDDRLGIVATIPC